MESKNEEMRQLLLQKPDIDEMKRSVDENPNDPKRWYLYALALGDEGMHQEAIDVFSQALCSFPFDAELHFGRGRKHIILRQYDRALADLTAAICLDPWIYSHWYYRGVVYNLSGDYENALRDFQSAMAITEPYEQFGLYDWSFCSLVEMGEMEKAKKLLEPVDTSLVPPQMHYGYHRRVKLYKGEIKPEDFIDEDDIRAKCVKQKNRFVFEMVFLLFGLFIYYHYIGDEEKANQALLDMKNYPWPGAFGCIKREDYLRKRGLPVEWAE